MIAILNNGTRVRISKELGQAVLKDLLNGMKPDRWVCGVNIENNHSVGLHLNWVSAICEEDDIVVAPL